MQKVPWTNKDGSAGFAWKAEYADPETGRRRTKNMPTKRELQAFLDEQKELRKAKEAEAAKPAPVAAEPHPGSGKTVAEACDGWYTAAKTIGLNGGMPVEESTWGEYERHIRLHINPRLGGRPVLALKPPDCERFRDDLLGGLSRELARQVLMHFKASLGWAVRQGWVEASPATEVKIAALIGRHKEKVKIPSRTEMQVIEAKLEELATMAPRRTGKDWRRFEAKPWRRWRIMVLVTERTGLRSSELRGMPKVNYHHNRGVLVVSQRADKKGRIGKVKSAAALRTLELDDDTNRALREWLVECPAGDFLFPTWDGTVEGHSNILHRCWYPLLRMTGLVDLVVDEDTGGAVATPRYDWHALRHFRASMLIATGLQPKELQDEMGHAKISTTMDIYGHLFPEDRGRKRAAAEAAAALLRR